MHHHKVTSEYHPTEEKLNVLTHALGFVLALVATLIFLFSSETVLAKSSKSIFGASMMLLYAASTLYHNAVEPTKRKRLKIFDHAAIYLLIAGTYTPFCLLAMPESGIELLSIIWGIAAVGVTLKLFFTGKFGWISTLGYVAMGWMVVFYFKELQAGINTEALYLLGYGGIAYTVGALLYSIKKVPYNHAIFHVCVLAGSFFHYLSICALS